SPDGRRIATGGTDTTVLIWDVPTPGTGADAGLTDEAAWRDLGDGEAARAFEAMVHLAASPKTAVGFLGKKMQPRPAADARRIAAWIAELDDDAYAVRENASAELADLGKSAEEALLKAEKEPASPEVKRRITLLLKGLRDGDRPGRRRAFRVVEVLEMMR